MRRAVEGIHPVDGIRALSFPTTKEWDQGTYLSLLVHTRRTRCALIRSGQVHINDGHLHYTKSFVFLLESHRLYLRLPILLLDSAQGFRYLEAVTHSTPCKCPQLEIARTQQLTFAK
jgi:hypothetical protein